MAHRDSKIKLISFSRNFGHQAAITSGMEMSLGDAVILIDADLQDPPEVIPRMIAKADEGYDVVYAVRKRRKGESIFKRASASVFYRILSSLTDIRIPVDAGDFRLISRPVCNALKRMHEKHRFVRGLTSWVGFRQVGIEYERQERFAGETKYPLGKMIKFSVDAITSFSSKPLRMSSYLGFIIAALGFAYSVYIVFSKIFYDTALQGWTTVICLICIIGGINLIAIGVVGEYIARLFDEAKDRPLYVVSETKNIGEGVHNRP